MDGSESWSAAAQRSWDLFVNWCAAAGADPLPCTLDTVELFLQQVPASPSTAAYRLSTICRAHRLHGYPFTRGDAVEPNRVPAELVDRELAWCVAADDWPHNFHARRDAWLVVLCHHLGMTRRAALGVGTADVAVSSGAVEIAGKRLPPAAEDPAVCRGCAVTRWLRVVAECTRWGMASARNLLFHSSPTAHDCGAALPGRWREVWALTPPIDLWGGLQELEQMSARQVSRVLSARLAQASDVVPAPIVEPEPDAAEDVPGPMAAWSTDEVLELLDQRTREADAAAQRIKAILAADAARFGTGV